MNALKVKIVNKSQWPDPAYATEASAGMDLRANITDCAEAIGKGSGAHGHIH